jgi:tetratricopeptide (TPR) repeat protein
MSEWGRAAAAFRLARQPEDSARNRARALEAGRPGRAARIWEKLGETGRAFDLYVQASDWPEVARLEDVKPEDQLRLLAHVRDLVDAGAWQEALPLIEARTAALKPRMPDLPWFVFLDKERLAWQEVCRLRDLEKKCRALEAEATEAWRRAFRLWADLGDSERAAAARARWVGAIPNPVRQARTWMALGDREQAVRTLEETAGLSAEAARDTVAAWRAERRGQWQEAAELWRSLGRDAEEARCLARAAKKATDGPAPAPAP